MLVSKVEKIKVKLDNKNIKKYVRTCRIFNREYNSVLSELLTEKYSLPTREEWDDLISDIVHLKKEIKSLKSRKKTEDEIFEESKEALKLFKGEIIENKTEANNKLLEEKEKQLELLLEHKNNIQILANNSNITNTTINYVMGGSSFDSYLKSYFQRILVTSIDRFKAKPKNKSNTEFNKPLAGLPKYRKISTPITLEFTNQSYRFLKNNKNKITGIKLGTLFPNIKFRSKLSDEFLNNEIKINNIALTPVSQYSIIDGKFYILINYEYENLRPLPNFINKVGIDVGLSDLVVTSDGEKFNYPEGVLEKIEEKRTRLQSILSIKKNKNKYWKKSKRYKKLKNRIDKLYAKEKNIREDFAHQVSRYLVNKYDVITMEDLNIQGMLKNKNLSFKIANASWNRLAILLEYKSKNNNKIFRKSYRFYPSTKICNNCKTESEIFKGPQSLSIRDWICPTCGTHHDRDINAAKNIRDWEPESENAISKTYKMIEKVRKSQLRDFTNWIVFSTYLDILRKDNNRKTLNKLLKLSNIKELNQEDLNYIDELLEKDKTRQNRKYDLSNNKIKELKGLKQISQLENKLRVEQLNRICLRLETLNIK
ncbi:IS605 OrfB family transposase [Ezakiella coagulans]|uniref:IS605 OrfB family transposase n=1 Tax=Ezakiella coagulans TaxID=46507 RepID=A0A2U1E3I5_9FIRM|nr:RNA-guided endonuclease TnpB family protein [Ezakiella coagulans]PVY94514.1 IS605 OrfB family transposase [Ezakiella coagulans]